MRPTQSTISQALQRLLDTRVALATAIALSIGWAEINRVGVQRELLVRLTPLSGDLWSLIFNGLLMFMVIYTSINLVFPNSLRRVFNGSEGLQLITSAYLVLFSLAFYEVSLSSRYLSFVLDHVLAYIFIFALLIPLGLRLSQDVPLVHAQSPPLRGFCSIINSLQSKDITPTQLVDEFTTYNTEINIIGSIFIAMGISGLYSIPLLILATFTGAFALLYPLLEIVALIELLQKGIVLLLNKLYYRLKEPGGAAEIAVINIPDIETESYRLIQAARTNKGKAGVLAVAIGYLHAVLILLLPDINIYSDASYLFVEAAESFIASPSVSTFRYVAGKIGFLILEITPIVVLSYLIWFWFRTLRRVPLINERPSPDEWTPPNKPVGFGLPAALTLLLYQLDPSTLFRVPVVDKFALTATAFVALMGLLFLSMFGSVWLTRQINSGSSYNPITELISPVAILWLSFPLSPQINGVRKSIAIFVFLLLFLIYLEDIYDVFHFADDNILMGRIAQGLLLGGLLFVITLYELSLVAAIGVGVGVVFISVAGGLFEHYNST